MPVIFEFHAVQYTGYRVFNNGDKSDKFKQGDIRSEMSMVSRLIDTQPLSTIGVAGLFAFKRRGGGFLFMGCFKLPKNKF
jgi:hypothetical protein